MAWPSGVTSGLLTFRSWCRHHDLKVKSPDVTKFFAINAYHRHGRHSHNKGTNGTPEMCTPNTLAILLPPTHDSTHKNLLIVSAESDARVPNRNGRCLTHVQCYYVNLHGDAHEGGHGLLTRVFDAKEKWVAGSIGLAPGLLPM